MKVIILVSSIFYILGLKISNKIDLVKRSNPIQKVIMHTVKPEKTEKSANFKQEETEMKEADTAAEADDCETIK